MKAVAHFIFLFLSVSAAAVALPQDSIGRDQWRFTALLDGKEIGYQTFSVDDTGGERIVRIEAEFDVKLLFVSVYEYSHRNREVWQDGCLREIRASTDDNGKRYRVVGRQVGDRFVIDRGGDRQWLNGCAMSFAYWDMRFLQQSRLLNSQTGAYQPVDIRELGQDSLNVMGRSVRARRYRLTAEDMQIDLWYSDEGRWLQLESTVNGDSILALKLRPAADVQAARGRE